MTEASNIVAICTRIFETGPTRQDIDEIAQAYARAVRDARQMDVTNASPEQFARSIAEAYPFHLAIRELYARFKENPGFQQTCGLIRLMRIIARAKGMSQLARDTGLGRESLYKALSVGGNPEFATVFYLSSTARWV